MFNYAEFHTVFYRTDSSVDLPNHWPIVVIT